MTSLMSLVKSCLVGRLFARPVLGLLLAGIAMHASAAAPLTLGDATFAGTLSGGVFVDDRQSSTFDNYDLSLPTFAPGFLSVSEGRSASAFDTSGAGGSVNSLVEATLTGVPGVFASARSSSLSPGYRLAADGAEITVTALAGATAQGIASYSFAILGPALDGPTVVPLRITSSGSASFSGVGSGSQLAQAVAIYQVFDPGLGILDQAGVCAISISFACDGFGAGILAADSSGFASFSQMSRGVQVLTNREYGIRIIGIAEVSAGALGGDLSSLASISPTIEIDPAFNASHRYSLVFSSGLNVPPAAPVPEPSQTLMMLIGMAFLYGIMRRRDTRRLGLAVA